MSDGKPSLPKRISEVVNGTLPLQQILEDLDQLPENPDKKLLFDVFSEIMKGCNSKSSALVDNAVKIIEELNANLTEAVMNQINGSDFQGALMYTLRGRTTRFGNKFSMHRELWKSIEDRVLGFYQKWHQQAKGELGYPNITKSYRSLKEQNIKFPEPLVSSDEGIDSSNFEKEKESLETFLHEYEKMINEGFHSSITQEIEFKIKEKLIYALNNVLLHEDPSIRLPMAITYNKRFNALIQKLNNMKSPKQTLNPTEAFNKEPKPFSSSKSIQQPKPTPSFKSTPQIKQPLVTKTSGLRSLIRSTLSYLSSHPSQGKDSESRQKAITKLDETIGDLVKYFDNHDDIKIENIPELSHDSPRLNDR